MPANGTKERFREATAFAPGHVTGFFAPDLRSRDPRGRGSVGAGIVLELGVRAMVRWRPSDRPAVRIRSDLGGPMPISRDVALRLSTRRPGSIEVRLVHDLPIGQGFGTSAAGALATALAVGSVVGASPRDAVATAHLADLFGGGGLGGVAAILGGGFEVRERAGVPPWGRIVHRAFAPALLLAVVGGTLPSPPLLRSGGFLDRVRTVSDTSLRRLARSPTTDVFLEESERFTDELALASPRLVRTIRALRTEGVRAGQAMFGQSLFAVASDVTSRRRAVRALERRRVAAVELHAVPVGARVEERPARRRP